MFLMSGVPLYDGKKGVGWQDFGGLSVEGLGRGVWDQARPGRGAKREGRATLRSGGARGYPPSCPWLPTTLSRDPRSWSRVCARGREGGSL